MVSLADNELDGPPAVGPGAFTENETGLLRRPRRFPLSLKALEGKHMSKELFVLALAVGAALLAVWTHARFPKLAPERMGKTLLHTGVAFVLLKLTPGLGDSTLAMFPGVFLILLSALVYGLLCSIWVLKLAQTALGVPR